MADGLPALVQASAAMLPFPAGIDNPINTSAVIKYRIVSDHHAIIPTLSIQKAELSSLSSGERDILSMVAVRLICAVSQAHTIEAVTAVLECGAHQFTPKGKTIIIEGWKAVDAAFRAL